MTNLDEIDAVFTYHAPHGDQVDRYQQIREGAKRLAELIFAFCPESRERLLALTSVQQAAMWGISAISIYERSEHANAESD